MTTLANPARWLIGASLRARAESGHVAVVVDHDPQMRMFLLATSEQDIEAHPEDELGHAFEYVGMHCSMTGYVPRDLVDDFASGRFDQALRLAAHTV